MTSAEVVAIPTNEPAFSFLSILKPISFVALSVQLSVTSVEVPTPLEVASAKSVGALGVIALVAALTFEAVEVPYPLTPNTR